MDVKEGTEKHSKPEIYGSLLCFHCTYHHSGCLSIPGPYEPPNLSLLSHHLIPASHHAGSHRKNDSLSDCPISLKHFSILCS